ncbi:unnamed protein product, partial [Laminaria digitata]
PPPIFPIPRLQRLKKLLDLPYVDEKNYERVCLYLLRMADYMSDPDDLLVRSRASYFFFL